MYRVFYTTIRACHSPYKALNKYFNSMKVYWVLSTFKYCARYLLIDLFLGRISWYKWNKASGICTQILVTVKCSCLEAVTFLPSLLNIVTYTSCSYRRTQSVLEHLITAHSAVLRKQVVLFNEMVSVSEYYFVLKSRHLLNSPLVAWKNGCFFLWSRPVIYCHELSGIITIIVLFLIIKMRKWLPWM